MAKKQKKTEFKRPLTKRQLSKWQRQQRIQRIIIAVGGLFFAFIVGYIGYGYYNEQISPLKEPVVRVNDTVFNMDYYIRMLDFYSQGQESAAVSSTADMVVVVMESGELMRQRAADLGVGVSEAEINSDLQTLQLPDEKVYRDMVAAQLLAAKLLRDYFDPKVPTASEQAKVQAMFLESEVIAKEVINSLEAGDDFASIAKTSSRETVTKEKGGDLGWLPRGFTSESLGDLGISKLEDIAFELEPGKLSEPTYDESVTKDIGYWILEVVEKDESKGGSHVSGILLGSWPEAEEIKAKLEAGEDFATLAQQYSQDSDSKESGGDLGWTQGGMKNRTVAGFAVQLEPGVISKPVADESVMTQGGYWLVKVEERDANRQLEDETRETLKLKLFEDWMTQEMEKSVIESYLSEEQKLWAVTRVLRSREQ